MEYSLLNSCCGVFVVFVVGYVLLNICCGVFVVESLVAEYLLWNLRC